MPRCQQGCQDLSFAKIKAGELQTLRSPSTANVTRLPGWAQEGPGAPQGQRTDRNTLVSRAEPEPPTGHQPPSRPSLLTEQAEPGGHLRSEKHDLNHPEIGTTGCDSSSTSYKPCGAHALLSGKISSLVCLPLQLQDPAGTLGLTRCSREARGSPRWDRQRCLGTRAQHTHGHGQCPGPATPSTADPRHQQQSQALAPPCARAPVTHPAHGNTCW